MKRIFFMLFAAVAISTAVAEEPGESGESIIASESARGTNPALLWGLAGFLMTFVPGVVGLTAGDQEWPTSEKLPQALRWAWTGAGIGAGVSLAFSFQYLKPTFYGTLVGFGMLGLANVAMYPEIVGAALLIALLSALGIIAI